MKAQSENDRRSGTGCGKGRSPNEPTETAKLGPGRALFYTEEQGRVEKFRPYALPKAEWLEEVKGHLGRKGTPPGLVLASADGRLSVLPA